MKLEFTLLVVDDVPDSIEQALNVLEDHLEDKGFSLRRLFPDALSESSLRELVRLSGKNYDLVIVDYNLGRDDTNGAAAAHRLRRDLPYTDIIFYSSDPELDLYGKLADQEVPGVFIARREGLGDALTGLADTVIGKAVDLNHMRGIAMAEVAEMDLLMEDTLLSTLRYMDDQCVQSAMRRTVDKLKRSIKQDTQLIEEISSQDDLSNIIKNNRLFSSINRYHTVRRVVKCLPGKPSGALRVLESYEDDIIHNRNMLAHVKEESTEDGNVILRSIKKDGQELTIDDRWMSDFRQKLQQHKSALTTVCEELEMHFRSAGTTRDPGRAWPSCSASNGGTAFATCVKRGTSLLRLWAPVV
jgi:CheY-like chemotaxis protein